MIQRSAAHRAGAALLLLAASCGLSAQGRTAPPSAKPAAAATAASAPADANANANARFSYFGLAPATAGLAQEIGRAHV